MGRARRLIGGVAAALLAAWPAAASGPGETGPWYLDQYGGPRADLQALYAGRLGVLMARAPRPQLYIAWRLLHGQSVGPDAGAALSVPCCDKPEPPSIAPGAAPAPPTGVAGWLAARKRVPGAPELTDVRTEMPGPNYSSAPNCFPDAFDTASATLTARAQAHGAASPEVSAWLAAQDGVFAACSNAGAPALPPAAPRAPAWLAADRAYQEAAFDLYAGRNAEAATRFAAIGRDPASPWRPSALYLHARALERAALAQKTPAAFAQARAAVGELQAAPPTTFGRDEARDMLRVIAFRADPKAFLAELLRELSTPKPPQDVASAFRDASQLYDMHAGSPDMLDWMATLAPTYDPALSPSDPDDHAKAAAAQLRLAEAARTAALAHARERWATTHDEAWLLAALSLAAPGAPGSDALAADALHVAAGRPAWLTARYQLVRLTLGTAPEAQTRARLDPVLARHDLSISDRNIFLAERLQVAADAAEFARLALRKRLCADIDWIRPPPGTDDGCVRDVWLPDSIQASGVYDGLGYKGSVGLGEDARAVIDRLPLAERIALSRDATLPTLLRLDVALTSYTRAVQLDDTAAVNALAGDLVTGLPQLAADWRSIAATAPGPDKRFAEYLVMAKIPGLRTDLVTYTRPEGKVAEFQQYWTDWILMPPGRPSPAAAPRLSAYQGDGEMVAERLPDAASDLACLGECGRGPAPLRVPDFARAAAQRAAAERPRFVSLDNDYGQAHPTTPAGGVAMWDVMLSYLRAHPADPRAPEALYWLVHVGRFGGSHAHSGRRAFELLHARYPTSEWARRTPYFFD